MLNKIGDGYLVKPQPLKRVSYSEIMGIDAQGNEINIPVIEEKPITLFLNSREIVTLMSVGDHLDFLCVGYLLNQNMLKPEDCIVEIEYDDEINVVVVRTEHETDHEEKLKRKTITSGCAMGTIFGDILDKFDQTQIISTRKLNSYDLVSAIKTIKVTPSLYQIAGSIHGCVLCQDHQPLVYMEDVGRHNAIDKLAGYLYLNKLSAQDFYLYTTGRMTSEMVIKAVSMGIGVLVSRSGATKWAVDLAKKAGLTLVSRAKGKRFIILSEANRIEFIS